ncbi:hypothetical protein J7297_02958 [Nakaseomyces glabratus]|nr:hypothetical protein J7298_02960 [Nakaseomyces glabratus]KAH7586665.1 hypothetical protein J7297_02958 [Nakaseomyces glabratus]KAH7590513.1 hypothetical protein J7296_02766 [Nakaseomyces glabratus]KAH7598767.1 hypothetical protein J7295_02970 [Nakaseomyces glabratus]KAH7613040.1 hypothetical protein J7292_02944 [Nakaseomyces glabratus]
MTYISRTMLWQRYLGTRISSTILPVAVRRIHYGGGRLQDPRYVFSKPPTNDPNQSKEGRDGKHFFTPSVNDGAENSTLHNNSRLSESEMSSIANAIAEQKRKRLKRSIITIFSAFVTAVLGYTIGYKVWYLKEQSFIPLYPCSRVRKLSTRDLRRVSVKKIEDISEVRVLERLSQHKMIQEEYGVPLRDSNGKAPHVSDFSVWCEDQDPCVTGLVFEPDSNRQSSHSWYRIPYVFKWRITHRPISISSFIDDVLNWINVSTSDLFEVISPEKVYGSFKYEYPIQGDNHSLHICFLGEMKLDENTTVIYKGKYHVDVKLERIDLLRTENKKLVRYILFKEEDEK